MAENSTRSLSDEAQTPSQAQMEREGTKRRPLEPAKKIFVHLKKKGRPRLRPKSEEQKSAKRGRPRKERASATSEASQKRPRGRPRNAVNKSTSGCHFELQCLGCRGAKSHKGHFRVALGCASDGTVQTLSVCRTAKLLVTRVGLAQYKAMIAQNHEKGRSELPSGALPPSAERRDSESGTRSTQNRVNWLQACMVTLGIRDEAVRNKHGHTLCHFKSQCLGCRQGSEDHFGKLPVRVQDAIEGSEKVIPVCKTAKLFVNKVGLDEYAAIIARHGEMMQTERTTENPQAEQQKVLLHGSAYS